MTEVLNETCVTLWQSPGRADVTTALLFAHAGLDLEAIATDLARHDVELIEDGERPLLALWEASTTLRDSEPLRTERLTAATRTDLDLPWFGAALTNPERLANNLSTIVSAHFISPVTARNRRRAILITQPFWTRNKIIDFAWLMTNGSPGTRLVPVLEPRAAAVTRFAMKTGWNNDASQTSIDALESHALCLLDEFSEQAIVWDRGRDPEGIDALFAAGQEKL